MVNEVMSAGATPDVRRVEVSRVLAASGAPAPAANSGNTLPHGGETVPVQAPPKAEVKLPDITRAVQNLNQFLESNRRSLNFRIDQASGRTIITVVNPETKEIVRQIPPEEVLTMARTLREAGVLFDALA